MQPATLRRTLLASALLVAACLAPGRASAGEADDHFSKGNAAFEKEKYDVALTEYQAAWKLTKAYDLAAIMGQAEMRLEKYKDAAEHFAYALKNFPLSGDEELRKNTEASLAMVKKELATVRVKAFVKDVAITIDGAALDPSLVGSDVFLAPGKVVIQASAPGYRSEKKTYEAKAGANEDVVLTLQPEGSSGRSATPAYVLGGVGVASVILGAVLVGSAEGKKGEAQKLHDEIGSDAGCKADPTKCKALRDAANTTDALGNAGVAAFVFGGLAGAAAGAYFLIPSRKPAKTGVSLTPVVSAGAGGVLVTGTF